MGMLGNEMSRSVMQLIREAGQTATFRRETRTAYDPATSATGPAVNDDDPVIAVMVQRKDSFSSLLDQIVGTTAVERGSRRVLMSAKQSDGATALSKVPQSGDLIAGLGDTVKVGQVHLLRVNDVTVAYALEAQD